MRNVSSSGADHAPQTPGTRTSKRLRHLDPESSTANENSNLTTGLTPRILRTRLVASSPIAPTAASAAKRDARNKQRRHTGPYAQSGTRKRKLGVPTSPAKEAQLCQYIPFCDIIDSRTRRRIGRSGFSEEINRIEETRRIQKKLDQEKDEELRKLRDELDRLTNGRAATKGITEMADDEPWDGLDSDTVLGFDTDSGEMCLDEEYDAFGLVDDPAPDSPCIPVSMDVGTQVSFHSCRGELQSLKDDLEQKKSEQRKLFQEWQRVIRRANSDDDGINGVEPPLSTPPPDLTVQVIASLRDATSRAAEAANTVNAVQKELSSHGFGGINAMEVINSIGARFRHARIELERAVPGETANANLSNWGGTIDALVERISRFVVDLKKAQEQIRGYKERETALHRQFDAALLRVEEASKKNQHLERYTGAIAEDMLNARMKLQGLEKEIESHVTDKTRLTTALEKYRDDIKMLERLNEQLEDEITVSRKQVVDLEIANNKLDERDALSKARIASLERKLSHEQGLRQRMQTSLDQCNLNISNLRQRMGELETQHEQVISALKEANAAQSEHHEREVGALNVRLSSITTSLSNAKVEREKLHEQRGLLERRLAQFQKFFSSDTIQAAQEKAEGTLKALEEWRRGIEVLDDAAHNEEIEADKTYSFCAIGSEPITPATVSRFRNVEVGREKKRKRNGNGNGNAEDVICEQEEWSDGDALEG